MGSARPRTGERSERGEKTAAAARSSWCLPGRIRGIGMLPAGIVQLEKYGSRRRILARQRARRLFGIVVRMRSTARKHGAASLAEVRANHVVRCDTQADMVTRRAALDMHPRCRRGHRGTAGLARRASARARTAGAAGGSDREGAEQHRERREHRGRAGVARTGRERRRRSAHGRQRDEYRGRAPMPTGTPTCRSVPRHAASRERSVARCRVHHFRCGALTHPSAPSAAPLLGAPRFTRRSYADTAPADAGRT